MTLYLRKWHKISWILIAILGTIFFGFTLNTLNFQHHKTLVEAEALDVRVEDNQLNITLNQPLEAASSMVYLINKKGEKVSPLGQISSTGNYTFNVDSHMQGILIYDEIKKTEIFKLIF